MADLGAVPWPPEPIGTPRLVLRQTCGGDRAGFIDLHASEEVGRRPDGFEVELGYLFLPLAWGYGYATEAALAVLDWVASVLPDEPVVLCTQTANAASVRLARRLGFVEVERFEEFGAEQWFGVRVEQGPPD